MKIKSLFAKKATPLTPLESLQAQSANAVRVIQTTIAQLQTTNDAIDKERANNDSAIVKLNATNAELDALKAGNAKVITNFKSLLS